MLLKIYVKQLQAFNYIKASRNNQKLIREKTFSLLISFYTTQYFEKKFTIVRQFLRYYNKRSKKEIADKPLFTIKALLFFLFGRRQC